MWVSFVATIVVSTTANNVASQEASLRTTRKAQVQLVLPTALSLGKMRILCQLAYCWCGKHSLAQFDRMTQLLDHRECNANCSLEAPTVGNSKDCAVSQNLKRLVNVL